MWWFIGLISGVVVVLNAIWVAWRYRLDDRPQPLTVPTRDGWTLTAWYRPAKQKRYELPVVLCHGLANNHAIMEFRPPQNLAAFLSDAGFDCYSVDLRGAGTSAAPDDLPTDATVDDHVQHDLPALLDAICERAKTKQVLWVGHSLGGVVALAAATTSARDRFAGIVTIGSPVFFAFKSQLRWLIRFARALSPWGAFDSTLIRLLAPIAGFVNPGKALATTANVANIEGLAQRFLLANVFAPIWKGVLAQLDDWIAGDHFRSLDRAIDYRARLQSLAVPVLVLGGSVDGLAPVPATRALFDALPPGGKKLVLFGREFGSRADYGHGDLIVGRHAHEEVYPVVLESLRHASPEVPVPGVGEQATARAAN